MTTPTISPYQRAERTRQAVLDYLNANPGAGQSAINAYLRSQGINKPADNAITTMQRWGEISHTGNPGQRRYTALTTLTMSAEECIRRRAGKISDRVAQQKALLDAISGRTRGNTLGDPVYIHKPEHSPHRSSGGQGAVRPRVTVSYNKQYQGGA